MDADNADYNLFFTSFRAADLSYNNNSRWSVVIRLAFTFLALTAFLQHGGGDLFGIQSWRWVLITLVLMLGRLVSGLGVSLILRKRKRTLYIVYALRHGIRDCLWLTLLLLTFVDTHPSVFGCLTRVFTCALVGNIIWLLKTLLVKLVASSFHVTAFFHRFRDSFFSQYLIHALALEEPSSPTALTLKAAILKKTGISIDGLDRLTRNNVSAWHMTRLMDAVRTGVLLPTPDEHLDHEKKVANRIVNNLAKQGSQRIYTADLMRFLREDEALKTIRLFDGEPETTGVSKEVFKSWVLHVYRDQKALSLSLKDIHTAGNKLHRILSFMVGVIIVAICLIILEPVHPYIVVFLCTTLLLPVFLFGIFCESVFKGILFLFVTHPYDVGDLCEIDGVQLIVQKMHILTTDFLIRENNKIGTYYNSLLATKPITNYHHFPDLEDAVDFCIPVRTPLEKITQLKKSIRSYIANDSDNWCPNPEILVGDVEALSRLKISIRPTHRKNFQDPDERRARRGVLIEAVIQVRKDLGIIEYC